MACDVFTKYSIIFFLSLVLLSLLSKLDVVLFPFCSSFIVSWHVDVRLRSKYDGTCAETRFRLFLRNGRVHLNRRGRQFSRLLAAEKCASAVVVLDTACSEIVWRVLATQYIRQFPLHLPCLASPCAIAFQLDSTSLYLFCQCNWPAGIWIHYINQNKPNAVNHYWRWDGAVNNSDWAVLLTT
jgi:hypothetical protein